MGFDRAIFVSACQRAHLKNGCADACFPCVCIAGALKSHAAFVVLDTRVLFANRVIVVENRTIQHGISKIGTS